MKLFNALLATLLAAGCGDDGVTSIDAAIDAEIDAPPGPCGADVLLTGEYIDWSSTIASFDGVENTVWTVIDEPTRTTTGAPNGRVILCIARNGTSQISMVQNTPGEYIAARFVADPAVFAPSGSTFSVRGMKTTAASDRFREIDANLVYDAQAAQVLVYKIGAPIPLALSPVINPPQRSYVSDGDDDITWSLGSTGALTLFPNRPVGNGTATLTSSSQFTGPTTLPLAAGKLTFTVIR